jgi:hypothetical protein
MHRNPENAGSLFQVASQFNLLEMISPRFTPEHGVTRYELDRTQGPACAISAGAATIYRNYFVPIEGVPGQYGQIKQYQVDTLADFKIALARGIGCEAGSLWINENGYVLPSASSLLKIHRHFETLSESETDQLRRLIKVGVHWDVECTETDPEISHTVTQVFCSALPIAYSSTSDLETWEWFARVVLEAAYEATLLVGYLNHLRGISCLAHLTLLGGGAFGNPREWIYDALKRALLAGSYSSLDVRIVSYGQSDDRLERFLARVAQG